MLLQRPFADRRCFLTGALSGVSSTSPISPSSGGVEGRRAFLPLPFPLPLLRAAAWRALAGAGASPSDSEGASAVSAASEPAGAVCGDAPSPLRFCGWRCGMRQSSWRTQAFHRCQVSKSWFIMNCVRTAAAPRSPFPNLLTMTMPFSPFVNETLPSRTRKDKPNTFSTVWQNPTAGSGCGFSTSSTSGTEGPCSRSSRQISSMLRSVSCFSPSSTSLMSSGRTRSASFSFLWRTIALRTFAFDPRGPTMHCTPTPGRKRWATERPSDTQSKAPSGYSAPSSCSGCCPAWRAFSRRRKSFAVTPWPPWVSFLAMLMPASARLAKISESTACSRGRWTSSDSLLDCCKRSAKVRA
mmetsp:Transcript_6460/g.18641  ORF Transcript_6460/g.18641 Transcript_6460/m.18641 type:complete len:354 (-) Transcript_6460:514-1575(-)